MTTWEAIQQSMAIRSAPSAVERMIKTFHAAYPDSVVTHDIGSNIFEVYYHALDMTCFYGFAEFRERAYGTLWN
jgi:hypothetical protein